MRQNRLFLIAIFIIIGSSNPIAIKYALNAGWPPFALGMLRMAVIGIFFTLWVMVRSEGFIGPNRTARRYVLIAALCKAVAVVLFYSSLSMIPANRAVVISTISPVVSLVLIHFILEHEHIRRHHVMGILVSLAGILLLISMREGEGENASTSSMLLFMGDILMIVSVVFNNTMVVLEKKALIHGASPGHLLVSTNIFSVIAFAIMFSFAGESFKTIQVSQVSIGAYLYLISVVGVFLFYYRRWLVSKLDVTYITSFSHLGKAVSIFYAVIFLGERMPLLSLLCFILILAGTIVATKKKGYNENDRENLVRNSQ